MEMGASMTHYMELLASNQPWSLILYMAIPVVLAEFIAVSELFILLRRSVEGGLVRANRIAGVIVGFYFVGIFVYLLTNAVIPLTAGGGWRGPANVIAVGFYLLGVVPLFGMALMGLGVLGRRASAERQLRLHASLVAVFLVVAHIAMIFGMLGPRVLV
jgi:hypothetical protein